MEAKIVLNLTPRPRPLRSHELIAELDRLRVLIESGFTAEAIELVDELRTRETAGQHRVATCGTCGHPRTSHNTPTKILRACSFPSPIACLCKGFVERELVGSGVVSREDLRRDTSRPRPPATPDTGAREDRSPR